MRNLKRALSLGLTAAMISGLMVMGSSAASYADVTSEQNEEAIEVLKAVEIMVGDENGNFNPDAQVTRNEMAVVMSNLMAYNVATYANTSPFTDVPSWAEPYVAACWTNGITAGYSATTYGGSDNVTTAQAALMLMKALGYFQYDSDFGTDWQLATITQGNKIDLFTDVDSGVKEAMTRNDLAQLVLNTLESGTVEASSDVTQVTTGDVNVTTGKVEYNYVTSQKDYAKAISDLEAVYATGISTSGYIVELGEKLYDGDLKKNEGTADDFGRPATEWKYGTQTVGTFSDSPDATFTTKVTKKALYDAVGKSVYDSLDDGEYDLYYYVDGYGQKIATNNIGNFVDKSDTAKINNDASDTGNGTLTEVFVDDDHDEVTVVVIRTYVFQATEDYNESNDQVKIAAAGDTAITLDNYTLDGDDFDISNVTEDDYLLITASRPSSSGKYEVQSVDVAELVSGEVTAYSDSDDVTIDGTTYKYSATTLDADGQQDEITSTGGQTSLVLDKYGYVIAVDDTIVGGNYVFITETDPKLGSAVDAYAYFSDGTEGIISLKKVNGSTASSALAAAKGWYTYSKDSNNNYTLSKVSGSYDSIYDMSMGTSDSAAPLTNGKASLITVNGISGLRANEKTIFVIVDDEGDVSAYTGVSNAPDVTVKSGTYSMGYVWRESNNYASYVFLNVEGADAEVDSSVEDDYFVFLTKLDSTKDDGNDTYYVYKAIVNGEETTVETDSTYATMKLYGKVKIDSSNDRITGMKEVHQVAGAGPDQTTDSTYYYDTFSGKKVNYSNGVLTIGTTSFVVNNGSQLNLILDYRQNAGSDKDVQNMMSDKGAKYEANANIGGSSIKSTLNGYTVDGYYYVITEDDYNAGTGNETVDYLFLYVDGATYVGTTTDPEEPADTEGTETVVSGSTVYVKLVDTNATTSSVGTEARTALRDAGYTSIDVRGVSVGSNGVDQTGGVVYAEDSNGDTVSFDVEYTNLWTVKVGDTIKAYVKNNDPYTVKADSVSGDGSGYLVNDTDYNDYDQDKTISNITSAQVIKSGYVAIPKKVTDSSSAQSTSVDPTKGYIAYNSTVTVKATYQDSDVTSDGIAVTLKAGTKTIGTKEIAKGATGDDLTVTFTFQATDKVTDLTLSKETVKESVTLTAPDVQNSTAGLTVTAAYDGDVSNIKEGDQVTVKVTVTGTTDATYGSTVSVSGVTGGSWVTGNLPSSASESGGVLTLKADTNYGSSGYTFEYSFKASTSNTAPVFQVVDKDS